MGCFGRAPRRQVDAARGKTDPLMLSAHEYTKSVFKVNNPFIKIVEGKWVMPPFDKFSKGVVNHEVRKCAIAECNKDISDFFSCYGRAKNGKQLLAYHHSLVKKLAMLTVPSEDSLRDVEERQVEYEYQYGKKRKRIDASDIQGLSDQFELLLDVVEDALSDGDDGELSDGDDGELSGGDDGEIDPEHTSYMKLYTLVKQECHYEKKLNAILQFKFRESDNACFQGACYACKEAPVNIQMGHTSPIYVLSLSDKWTYSILHVRGEVSLKNGTIDPSSLDAFRKTEEFMGFKPISGGELDCLLKEGTKLYKTYAPASIYPDGEYLVGTLYVYNEWRELPRNQVSGCNTADVHNLYEGLLRIIIGDSVINWTKETVEAVIQVRKKMKKEMRDMLLA